MGETHESAIIHARVNVSAVFAPLRYIETASKYTYILARARSICFGFSKIRPLFSLPPPTPTTTDNTELHYYTIGKILIRWASPTQVLCESPLSGRGCHRVVTRGFYCTVLLLNAGER